MNQNVKKRWITITLVLSFFISSVKFAAYYFTRSNAVLSDAAESIMNIVASLFALFSVSLAAKPKDLNHPYGHGKVEFFALGFEGALIVMTGMIILYKSIFSFIYHTPIDRVLTGALLIGLTGAVNGILGLLLIKKSKELASITLYAEGKHLLSDTLSSFGIVIGLVIIHYTGFFALDGLISLLLGLWMLLSGYRLARRSVAGLMDEADRHTVEEIIAILNQFRSDNWVDIHNMRAQSYGENLHIDCHITLPYYFDLKEMGFEIFSVKSKIHHALKTEVELFIQAEPCDPECCHYCRKKDCPVRQEPKQVDIAWDYERLVINQKHYLKLETGFMGKEELE